MNTCNALGGAWEFILVDDDGRVVAPQVDRASATRLFADPRPLPTEMTPEADIAWSATALWRIKRDRGARLREARATATARRPGPATRGASLGSPSSPRSILERVGRTRPHRSRADAARDLAGLSARYPDHVRGLAYATADVVVQGLLTLLPRSAVRRARRRLRAALPDRHAARSSGHSSLAASSRTVGASVRHATAAETSINTPETSSES